jgi:Tfp pilus assembly protein PilX
VVKKHNPNSQAQLNQQRLLLLMLRAQQIANQDSQQEQGYAMVIVAIVSVSLLSLLGAFLTLTNLSTLSTNAYVDGTNTFYAAESGLNARANELRQKFSSYTTPSGLSPGQATTASVVSPTNIINCFSLPISTPTSNTNNDFECRNYAFRYNNNAATVKNAATSQAIEINKTIHYTAFTFVADKTVYDPTSAVAAPLPSVIQSGPYEGLNAQRYIYSVYSTAAKIDPANPASSAQRGDAKTVLQLDFKSQVIPLFQFGAFYDRDLEINSTTGMTLNGRVHTNANFYVQPTPFAPSDPGIDFLSKVTVFGDIYNRVDAAPTSQNGTTRVLISSSPNTYASFPAYDAGNTNPITDLSPFLNRVANQGNGVKTLNPPAPGFLRKRNYYTNKIGAYYGKADLRLEMTPNSPIPFKFTAIQSGVNARGGTCTTAYTPGEDPPQNYIDPSREGSNFKCTQFSVGQITSLQQPVLVLTRGSTEEEARFCAQPTDGSIDRNRSILNYAGVTADPTTAGLSAAQIDKVLRALQVATSAAREPLDYATVAASGTLPTEVQSTFATLLANGTLNIGLTPTQINAISTASPASIAKARRSCFLPAPIQVVANNKGYNGDDPPTQPTPYIPWVPPASPSPSPSTSPSPSPSPFMGFLLDLLGNAPANAATLNSNSYGLFEPRDRQWMQILQTNLESLTVWNRDGRFVSLSATGLTVPATTTDLVAALNSSDPTIAPTNPAAADAFSGNGVLFVRAQPNGTNVGSFDRLGLAAADMSEAGLVFHATVNDYLDGRTPDGNPDAFGSSSHPIYKLDSNRNWAIDSNTGQPIILDYYRLYPYSKAAGYISKSIYAFAFNGGKNLPGALTIATDQAIYLQGDYNTSVKKPAAVMADVITALSVNCLSPGKSIDPQNVPTAEINCLVPDWITTGNSPWTGNPIVSSNGKMYGAQTTSVNAAFLSFTQSSWGNLGVNRGYGGWNGYSGGLNNYMRFVEDWSGQTFNYNGSLVSLGTPLEFDGWFKSGGMPDSYFSPPNRNFTYDTDFNSFPKLPPMTPSVIYLQQDAFKRN